jgi:Mg2+ and Co2+ transporter CorA
MMKQNTARKKRTDRMHIIYQIVTAEGSYIGVTAKTESTVLKSIRARAAKHFYRAKKETKDWLLCEALRKLTDKSQVDIRAVELIRGKKPAHTRERELIAIMNPELNTDKRGM